MNISYFYQVYYNSCAIFFGFGVPWHRQRQAPVLSMSHTSCMSLVLFDAHSVTPALSPDSRPSRECRPSPPYLIVRVCVPREKLKVQCLRWGCYTGAGYVSGVSTVGAAIPLAVTACRSLLGDCMSSCWPLTGATPFSYPLF